MPLVQKNSRGLWEASTLIKNPDGTTTKVLTMKRSNGILYTTRSVVEIEVTATGTVTHYDPFSEVNQRLNKMFVMHRDVKRATENTVALAHLGALKQFEAEPKAA